MYEVLKPFPYSHDGFTARRAERGAVVDDLPEGCIPGLLAEGYVRAKGPRIETQAFAAAPENQAIESAPENKGEPDVAQPARRGRPPKAAK